MIEGDADLPSNAHPHKPNRRQFLGGSLLVSADALAKSIIPPLSSPPLTLSMQNVPNPNSKPSSEKKPKPERPESTTPPVRSLSEIFKEIDQDTRTKPDEKRQLKDIMQGIDAEKRFVIQTVWDHNILTGERSKTRESIARDLDIYYPIYKAVEAKYNIPWQLVWMMHTEETGASIHQRPDHGATRGAVQIGYSSDILDKELLDLLEEAMKNTGIYKFIPGLRYDHNSLNPKIKKLSKSNDGEQLMAFGEFFSYITSPKHNPHITTNQSAEEKDLEALKMYVGQPNIDNGVYAFRKGLYKKITSILPASENLRISPPDA